METTTLGAPKDISEMILTAKELLNKFKLISHITLKSTINLTGVTSARVETSTTTDVVMTKTQ